jgi:mannose-6-phosphate isomerase-like protein (cupin superfamily)
MSKIDHPTATATMQTEGTAASHVVSRPDEGGWFTAIPGERLKIRVSSPAVGGRYSILESVIEPGFGPPLHTHREDEIFEIIEGTMTFQAGSERFEAEPGTIVAIPAGVHHAWANFGKAPARMLATFSPGGIETLFTQVADLPPENFLELVASYGSVIVGPPLAR